FVGRDFLPRGSGIVTRCPLILQLIYRKNEEYGLFLHNQAQEYRNFNDIRDEIIRETDRKIGNNKNVSRDPITLRIYSPNVLDLTLIDLPGITRNPIDDQPKDIEEQTIKIVREYITRKNCLILAVSAANQGLSDALKIAREVDPDGERTISVLTKLDIMDEGTNARDILDNKVVPLKRGYIGVVNRSQADINNNIDIRAAIDAEDNFFKTHDAYHDIASRLGTPFLQKTLNEQLIVHIRNALPALVNRLETILKEVSEQQKQIKINFGDANSNTNFILNALNEIKEAFEMKIGLVVKSDLVKDKLTGGALIKRIMNEKYRSDIQQMSFNKSELRSKISIAIPNIRGVNIGIFTPDMAFETVVRDQLVTEELLKTVRECCTIVKAYPRLREKIENLVTQHIQKCQQKVKNKIEDRIQIESAYMNTDHDDFIGLTGAMRFMAENNVLQMEDLDTLDPSPSPNSYWLVIIESLFSWFKRKTEVYREDSAEFKNQVELIRILVDSYLTIMKKNMQDYIPKLLMHDLINHTCKFLSTDLHEPLLACDDDELLKIDPEVEKMRDELAKKHDCCEEALKVIRQISNESL
ncbi:dynamin-like protein, partial [Leptotrombidium deliense]